MCMHIQQSPLFADCHRLYTPATTSPLRHIHSDWRCIKEWYHSIEVTHHSKIVGGKREKKKNLINTKENEEKKNWKKEKQTNV